MDLALRNRVDGRWPGVNIRTGLGWMALVVGWIAAFAQASETSIDEVAKFYAYVEPEAEALTAEQTAYAKARDVELAQIRKLASAGKQPQSLEAIRRLEELIAHDKQMFGIVHRHVATRLLELADLYSTVANHSRALLVAREAIQMRVVLFGQDDVRTREAALEHFRLERLSQVNAAERTQARQADRRARDMLNGLPEKPAEQVLQECVALEQDLNRFYGEGSFFHFFIFRAMGRKSMMVGDYAGADQHLEAANQLALKWHGPVSRSALDVLLDRFFYHENQGQVAPAEQVLEQAIILAKQIPDMPVSTFLDLANRRARLAKTRGQESLARAIVAQAYATAQKHPEIGAYWTSQITVAYVRYVLEDRPEEGARLLQEVTARFKREGNSDLSLFDEINDALATVYIRTKRYDDALKLMIPIELHRRQVFGRTNITRLEMVSRIAEAYEDNNDLVKAIEWARTALVDGLESLGSKNRVMIDSLFVQTRCLDVMVHQQISDKKFDEAVKLAQERLSLFEKTVADDAYAIAKAKRLKQYAEMYRDLSPDQRSQLELAVKQFNDGQKLYEAGRMGDALQLFRQCFGTIDQLHAQRWYGYITAHLWYIEALGSTGDREGVGVELAKHRRLIDETFPRPIRAVDRQYLASSEGKIYAQFGLVDQAIRGYREAIGELRNREGIVNSTFLDLAFALLDQMAIGGFYRDGDPVAGEVMEVAQRLHGPQSLAYAKACIYRGVIQARLGNGGGAETLYATAAKICESVGAPAEELLDQCQRNQALLYVAKNKFDEAVGIRQKSLSRAQAKGNRPVIIENLRALGDIYRQKADFDQSEARLKESLQIAQAWGNQQAIDGVFNELERTWIDGRVKEFNSGHFDKAVTHAEKLVEQRTTRFGNDSLYLRDAQVSLREMKRWSSLTQPIVDQLRSALRQFENATNEPPNAEAYERAAAHSTFVADQLGTDNFRYLGLLENLSRVAVDLNRFAEAESYLQQYLEIVRSMFQPGSIYELDAMYGQARVQNEAGRYADAAATSRAALGLLAKTEDRFSQHLRRAAHRSNLGYSLSHSGSYAAGISEMLDAYEILMRQRTDNPVWYFESLLALAEYRATCDTPTAAAYARQLLADSEAIFGRDSRRFAEASVVAASIAVRHQQLGDAEKLARYALAVFAKLRCEQIVPAIRAHQVLANVYANQNDLQTAMPLMSQALADLQRVAPDGREIERIEIHSDLALLQIRLGHPEQAEALLRPLVSSGRKAQIADASLAMQDLKSVLATSLLLKGNRDEAFEIDSRQLEQDEQNQWTSLARSTERDQLVRRAQMSATIGRLMTAGQNGFRVGDSYARVLQYKGSVMTRQLQLRRAKQNPQIAEAFDRWSRVSGLLAKHYLRQPAIGERNLWDLRLAQWTAERDQLEMTMFASVGQMEPDVVSPEEIADALPPQTLLIDMVRYRAIETNADREIVTPGRYALFISRKGQTTQRVDVADGETVDSMVTAWRNALNWRQTPEAQKAVAERDEVAFELLMVQAMVTQINAANQIHTLVWEPLQPFLQDVQTILVAADGELTKFPLTVLPGKESDSYLIEDYAFVNVPLISSLRPREITTHGNATADDADPGRLLVLGDVNYDAPRRGATARTEPAADVRALVSVRFTPLAGTGPEAAAIKQVYESRFSAPSSSTGVTLLTGDEANESNYVRAARTHRWLHLATHGFFAEEIVQYAQAARLPLGLQSAVFDNTARDENHAPINLMAGLALAQANFVTEETEDDGILSAAEVAAEDLQHVELAVLSACEAILGKSVPGEGMLGLQRALHIAGVRSTITTQWPVLDQAARLIMSRFYINLWEKKMTRSEALREAQIWCLRTARQTDSSLDMDIMQLDARSDVLPRMFVQPATWAPFVLGGEWNH